MPVARCQVPLNILHVHPQFLSPPKRLAEPSQSKVQDPESCSNQSPSAAAGHANVFHRRKLYGRLPSQNAIMLLIVIVQTQAASRMPLSFWFVQVIQLDHFIPIRLLRKVMIRKKSLDIPQSLVPRRRFTSFPCRGRHEQHPPSSSDGQTRRLESRRMSWRRG